MIRKLLALSVFTLLVTTSSQATEDPELRKILNKHVDAIGGWQNWNKVESIRLSGTIERDEQIVDFVIIKKRPNQIRATITMPIPGNEEEKLQVIRAFDGEIAWGATRMTGAQELNKLELDQSAANELSADAGVLPKLVQLWQEGADLSLHEATETDNYVITASIQNGENHIFEIDSETYRSVRMTTNDRHASTRITEFGDYTEISGVYVPKTTTIQDEKTGNTKMLVESAVVGVGIYEEYFSSQSQPSTSYTATGR